MSISVIWSPYLKPDIKLVQQTQKRFTKHLHGLRHCNMKTDLSFWICRLWNHDVYVMTWRGGWCCKIVFGLTVLKSDDFFEWNTAMRARDHAFKLYKRTFMCRAVFFQSVFINVWNQLPESADFSSLTYLCEMLTVSICLVVCIFKCCMFIFVSWATFSAFQCLVLQIKTMMLMTSTIYACCVQIKAFYLLIYLLTYYFITHVI